jgi:peptide chain release factor 2
MKIEWGSQIRSYVLHPYKMVNDVRTELKITNAQGVLDGDLDELIKAYLMQLGGKKTSTTN